MNKDELVDEYGDRSVFPAKIENVARFLPDDLNGLSGSSDVTEFIAAIQDEVATHTQNSLEGIVIDSARLAAQRSDSISIETETLESWLVETEVESIQEAFTKEITNRAEPGQPSPDL